MEYDGEICHCGFPGTVIRVINLFTSDLDFPSVICGHLMLQFLFYSSVQNNRLTFNFVVLFNSISNVL